MTSVDWYVNKPFHLALVGGEDFEFALGVYEIVKTTLDGKVTDIQRGAAYDFTGWSAFYAAMAPEGVDGVTKVLSLVIDGAPTNGELRLFGRGTQTWEYQQLGYRAGDVTLMGLNPAGQRKTIALGVWDLTPGTVSPTTPSVPDWGSLT